MNPLYNAGIRLYALGAKLASARSDKVRKMLAGQAESIDRIQAWRRANQDAPFDVWVHVASLGEFEQARPLLERLRSHAPEQRVLLTFFSPSGYEVRKDYDKVDLVAYLPFDTPGTVERFLTVADPKMAIFVKYEFWGNYLQQLQQRSIPTYIIDAIFRPGQRFFKSYGSMFRQMLHCFSHIYVQDQASQQLLASIGVKGVTVAGDTRFDRVTDIMRSTVRFPVIERWVESHRSPVLIAGSSWGPDEDCYVPYLNSHPGLRAIIAPHEFDAGRLSQLQARLSGRSMLMSQAERQGEVPEDVQAVIVDSFGKLSSLYRYGSIALVGGGFGAGIHNINEAAVYGMPVVFGPNHYKFKEAADLIELSGAFEYSDAATLARILDMLLGTNGALMRRKAGEAAGSYIKANLGATDKIFKDLFVKK